MIEKNLGEVVFVVIEDHFSETETTSLLMAVCSTFERAKKVVDDLTVSYFRLQSIEFKEESDNELWLERYFPARDLSFSIESKVVDDWDFYQELE